MTHKGEHKDTTSFDTNKEGSKVVRALRCSWCELLSVVSPNEEKLLRSFAFVCVRLLEVEPPSFAHQVWLQTDTNPHTQPMCISQLNLACDTMVCENPDFRVGNGFFSERTSEASGNSHLYNLYLRFGEC